MSYYTLEFWLSLLLFAFGLIYLALRIYDHPFVERKRVMKGRQGYFFSRIDEVPSTFDLFKRQAAWLLIALLWIFMFARMKADPEHIYLLLLGLMVLLFALSALFLDLLARPYRALELTSYGISYLEEDFDYMAWGEIEVIVDYQQAVIIKTEEDIFEFTFECDPGDYFRFLEVLAEVREKHQLALPYHKL